MAARLGSSIDDAQADVPDKEMPWKTEPTENVRAAFPDKYWFHSYDGRQHFMWDDLEVSEAEFRRYASAAHRVRADKVIGGH